MESPTFYYDTDDGVKVPLAMSLLHRDGKTFLSVEGSFVLPDMPNDISLKEKLQAIANKRNVVFKYEQSDLDHNDEQITTHRITVKTEHLLSRVVTPEYPELKIADFVKSFVATVKDVLFQVTLWNKFVDTERLRSLIGDTKSRIEQIDKQLLDNSLRNTLPENRLLDVLYAVDIAKIQISEIERRLKAVK